MLRPGLAKTNKYCFFFFFLKNPPANAGNETRVRSLGWEGPLEKEMATHSSIFAWRIPMDREAWQATVHGVAKSRIQLRDRLSLFFFPFFKWGLEYNMSL